MNKVSLIGRVTKDIELRYTQSQKAVTRFTLAVNRRGNNKESDFISCIAWEKPAEVLSKYVKKGHRVGITGHIQTGSYDDKDGKKVYTTDIVVEELEFLEKKSDEPQPAPDDFVDVPQDIADDLPFK